MDNAARIRVAAARLFAVHGFDGVALQAIADEVGVAKQTLLYHYPSKEELRRAVIEQVFEHWRSTLPQILQAVTSGKGRFVALTEELLRFFTEDRNRARLLARELLDQPTEMQQLIIANLRPWLLLVAEYVREGQKSGLIRPSVDPEAYVLHVIAMVVATVASLGPLSTALAAESGQTPALEERYLDELLRLTRTALFSH